ncbi:MAG: iron ABC transporter permease [Gammaproteobacteria bacterium]
MSLSASLPPRARSFDTPASRLPINPWTAATLVVALVVALPILGIPWLALFPRENIWPHLVSTVLPGYVLTTLALMLGVTFGVLTMGVTSAWLVTMCRFPGRRIFEWAMLLPMAVPAYVVAYVYTDLLEYAGPVQIGLRHLFGWQSATDYWFPEIRSLGGAIAMMSMVLYPYVYLLSRAAFLEQSVGLLDASRTLGCGPWATFFRVSLPMARPSIATGAALALMETLNDVGTVDFFAVQTLTLGIYDVWLNMGNIGGAAQIAMVMLVFVIVLLTVERQSRRRHKHYQISGRLKELPAHRLVGARGGLAFVACLLPVAAGFIIPASMLVTNSLRYFDESWTPELLQYALNSLTLSFGAALAAVCIALLLAYGRRLVGGKVVGAAVSFASVGYAVPGAVLAIGVIIPLAGADNALDAFMREHFGISTGLVFSGTVFAILFAYVVRFLAIALGSIDSSLAKVTPAMDMAARTLGHGPMATFFKVHLPLIRGGVLIGVLVVFVDCMKELPATLILRPFNFDTLATYVYQFASDELIEQASLGALGIVVAGLIPVVVLSRVITATRQTQTV